MERGLNLAVAQPRSEPTTAQTRTVPLRLIRRREGAPERGAVDISNPSVTTREVARMVRKSPFNSCPAVVGFCGIQGEDGHSNSGPAGRTQRPSALLSKTSPIAASRRFGFIRRGHSAERQVTAPVFAIIDEPCGLPLYRVVDRRLEFRTGRPRTDGDRPGWGAGAQRSPQEPSQLRRR